MMYMQVLPVVSIAHMFSSGFVTVSSSFLKTWTEDVIKTGRPKKWYIDVFKFN
jgi:hypothetical protein